MVSSAINSINPFIPGYVGKNQGYTTSTDGTRKPIITYYPLLIQVQAATEDMLKFASNQGIQGAIRSVYLYNNWTALIRPDNFGGDIVNFEGKDWLVIQVNEHWPDWAHVTVALQNNHAIASGDLPSVILAI